MPKLSNKSLEKRFTCQYCDDSFRTRQGLSGHIQWKHQAGKKSSKMDLADIVSTGISYQTMGTLAGLPQSQIKANLRILAKWVEVEGFCDYLKIKLSPQDFKNYIIVSMAQQHAVEA